MDIQILYVCSGVGVAILSFTAGFMLARMKKKYVVPIEEYPYDQEIVEDLRHHLQKSMGERETALQTMDQMRKEYFKLGNEYDQIKVVLQRAKNEYMNLVIHSKKLVEELNSISHDRAVCLRKNQALEDGIFSIRQRCAALEKDCAGYTRVRSELEKISEENEAVQRLNKALIHGKNELFREMKELQKSLKDCQEQLAGMPAIKEKMAQFLALKTEKETLAGQCASQVDTISDLKNRISDMTVQMDVLRQQTQDSILLQNENLELKEECLEMEQLRTMLSVVKQENAALRAKGIVLEKPDRPQTVMLPQGFARSLDVVLSNVGHLRGNRGAVVADHLGLPVAGTGPLTESLAAMSAVFSMVDERIHSMVDFGAVKQVIITDENRLSLTMYPFKAMSDLLVLISLSIGPGPDVKRFRKMLEQVDTRSNTGENEN